MNTHVLCIHTQIELTYKQPLQWRRSSVVETALVSDLDSAPNEMLHLGLVI